MSRMIRGVAATVLLCAVCGAAASQERVTNPQWIEKPEASDLEPLYPDRARREKKGGRATIECTVGADGRVSACSVVSESPAGYGFGEATVRAAPTFRMKPRTVDGKPVGDGVVQISVVWQLEGGVMPPRVAGLDPAIIGANPVVIYGSSAYYPAAAKRAKVEGRAVVECLVLASHAVTECRVLGEIPLDQGFGLAGVRRVKDMEIKPTRELGETAGRKVRFPIYWKLGDSRSRGSATMERDPAGAIQPPPPPGRE